jgi:hypothetical protein
MADDKEKLVKDSLSSNPGGIYAGRHVLRLGVTQIVIGCLVIAAQIVVFSVYNLYLFSFISHGIWCGAAFFVCGVIGILAGKRRTTCLITSHLVLCILACIFSGAIISLSALTSVYNYGSPYTYHSDPVPCFQPNNYLPRHNHEYPGLEPTTPPSYLGDDYWNSYYNGYGSYGARYPCYNGHYVINDPWVIQFTMNLFMGTMGIINAILSLVAGTLSCVPLCCDPFKQQLKDDHKKQLLNVTSQEQEQAGPLPVKVAPSDVIIVASQGSSHI